MRTINFKSKYSKQAIIEALEKFRKLHIDGFDEARKVYMEKRLELLTEAVDFARTYTEDGLKKSQEKINSIYQLVEPQDMRKEYDNLINLIIKAQDDELELDSHQANFIFNDEWDWAISAKVSNSFYSNVG